MMQLNSERFSILLKVLLTLPMIQKQSYICTSRYSTFSGRRYSYFSYFSIKHTLWYSSEDLSEALLMITHNICFHGKITKILCGSYPTYLVLWTVTSQLAFYVNLHRAVIGPSATLTGRWRPDIDLRRILTGIRLLYSKQIKTEINVI